MRKLKKLITLGMLSTMVIGCVPPMPKQHAMRHRNIDRDMHALEKLSCLPDDPLTLEDVLCIGLQQNMDLLVQQYQMRVQCAVADAARMQQLPDLAVNYDLNWRDKPNASLFRNLETGTTSAGTTTSGQTTNKWNLRAAFSLLDFGLSYYRTRQEMSRAQIRAQELKKARQNFIYEIMQVYWRAVVAQKNEDAALEMIATIEDTIEVLQEQHQYKTLPEMTLLQYEKDLIDMQRRLATIQYELQTAKMELAGMMGVPCEADFRLADVEMEDVKPLGYDVRCLEEDALFCRPELYAQDIEEHIYVDEVRSAILRMFPNVELFSSFDEDNNRQIIHGSWFTYGMTMAFQLMDIPEHLERAKAAKLQQILIGNQRLATSIGVITQVNIAHINYQQRFNQYRLAKLGSSVQNNLLRAGTKEHALGDFSGVDLLDIRYEAIVASLEAWTAYADLQMAVEQLNHAIGQPLCYGLVSDKEIFDFDEKKPQGKPIKVEIKVESDTLPTPQQDLEENLEPVPPPQVGTPVPITQSSWMYRIQKPSSVIYSLKEAQGQTVASEEEKTTSKQ